MKKLLFLSTMFVLGEMANPVEARTPITQEQPLPRATELLATPETEGNLIKSILSEDLETAQKLIKQSDTNLDYKDKAFRTALIHATRQGYPDLVEALIKKGANLDAKDYLKKNALAYAVENNYKRSFDHLRNKKPTVEGKAGIDKPLDSDGKTALMYAAIYSPDSTFITSLISEGADLNAQDNNKKTALMYAAKRKDMEIAKALKHAGAKLGILDKTGRNAAAFASSKEMKALLAPISVTGDILGKFNNNKPKKRKK